MCHYVALFVAAVLIGALASVVGIIAGRVLHSAGWGILIAAVSALAMNAALVCGVLSITPGGQLPPSILTPTHRSVINLGIILAVPCVAWCSWNTWWNLKQRKK